MNNRPVFVLTRAELVEMYAVQEIEEIEALIRNHVAHHWDVVEIGEGLKFVKFRRNTLNQEFAIHIWTKIRPPFKRDDVLKLVRFSSSMPNLESWEFWDEIVAKLGQLTTNSTFFATPLSFTHPDWAIEQRT